ncbi:MAG: GAF domain-containing protein [Chloroflexota bacterium]|nr:GAF domain-containing protein [Chloroflexota bacterium]
MSIKRILIIDDEPLVRHALADYLTARGYETVTAADGDEGLAQARTGQFHVILIALRIPRPDGLEIIAALHAEQPELPLVVISETGALGDAVEAMRRGAWDYVAKPIRDMEGVAIVVERALERARLLAERKRAEESLRQERDMAQKYLDIAGAILVALNEKGEITLMNRKGREILGYEEGELVGRNWFDACLPTDAREDVRHVFQQLMAGEIEPVETHENLVLTKSGAKRTIAWYNTVLTGETGKISGILSSGEEITERKRAAAEVQRRAAQAALIYEVGQRVSGELELDVLLSEITVAIRDAFEYDNVMLLMLDEENKRLTLRSIAGDYAAVFPEDFWLAVGEGMIGHATVTGETQVSGDVSQNPHYVRKAQETTQSELVTPIKSGDKMIGVLDVQSKKFDVFAESDVVAMETLSTQIAAAIENARLFEETQRRAAQLALINDVGEKIASVLDLDSVLERAARLVQESFGYHHVAIFTVDREQGEVVMTTRAGDFVNLFPPDHRLKLGQGMVGWTGRHGKRLLANDVDAEPRYVNLYPDVVPTRSELCAPIRAGGEVVGVLDAQSPQRDAFDENDALVLETVAGQIAVAIENARLHGEALDHAEQLEQRVRERTAQLAAERARLEAILYNASDGIVVANNAGDIVQANPVAQEWLAQTLALEEAARLREAVRSVATQAEEQPVELLELTGLDLEVKAAPISEPGLDEAAVVIAIHDISHLKSLDRMKTRFITNISHELRTPITTVKLYAHLMRKRSDKWEQYLDTLAQEAEHLARLVEDILEISRIDSGRLEMKSGPTSLNELTEAVAGSHREQAQERGLALEYRPAEPGPVALADSNRIMQALINLVGNGIRYTPEGGKVTVSTGKQETKGRAWATVTVADTGMGIPDEELPRIFERFFRGKEPRDMQLSGTGLGLSIAQEIVELHGGQVTVESEKDVGSVFTVWLPLAE